MSKFGNKLYDYNGIQLHIKEELDGVLIELVSNHGKLDLLVPKPFQIEQDRLANKLAIRLPSDFLGNKKLKAMWGTLCSLFNSKIKGLKEPFQKKIQLVGVGFKVVLQTNQLLLKIGYSIEKTFPLVEGVKVTILNPTNIMCSSVDAELLGSFVDRLTKMRKYNIFTGSGLIVSDKHYLRKEKKGGK